MKKLTLEFQSLALEKKFQKHSQLVNVPLLINVLKLFIIIIVIPCMIIAIFNRRYIELIIFSIGGVSIFVVNYIIKKFQHSYNIVMNISLIIFISISAFKIYFYGETIGEDDAFALFFFGSVMIQAQQIFHNISSTFLPSALSQVVQTIMYLGLTWDSQIYTYKYIYIVFNVFLIYFLYCQIKSRKETYMLRENERQWAKIVKSGLSQQIITVKFDQKQNNLQLDIVNKNAMQKFKISNENEFKEFSRKLKLYTQSQDLYQNYQSKLISINNDLDTTSGMTLENQILSYLKSTIKDTEYGYLQDSKGLIKTCKNSEEKLNQQFNKKFVTYKGSKVMLYYAQIESADMPQKYERYKIKLSYFQSQTSHRCCIIFDQESDQEKVKNLEEARKRQQLNFVRICLDLAFKIQYITCNLLNFERSKEFLYLSLNKLQNVYDHHLTISSNAIKNKIIHCTSISIGEIIEKVKETFWDQQYQISFEFNNCSEVTSLQTNIKLLTQVMTNFLINSLNQEIQEAVQQCNNMNQSKVLQLYSPKKSQVPKKQNVQISSPRRLMNITVKKILTSSQIMSENGQPEPSTFNDLVDKIKDLKTSTFLQYKNKNKSFQFSSPVKVKFNLINGDNDQSHILKISIKDKSGGMSPDSLLENLKNLTFNSIQENFEYTYFQNLGWKNNCNAIGKLGPYSDFFISPKYVQGLKVIFFLYTDMSMIDVQNSSYSFSNKKFFEEYNNLLENYFHKNQNYINIKCKQTMSQCIYDLKSKRNSADDFEPIVQESLIENANVNEIYRFQFLDEKKLQSPTFSYTNRENYLLKSNTQQSEVMKDEQLL